MMENNPLNNNPVSWHPEDVIPMEDGGGPGCHIKSKAQAIRILETILDHIPEDSPVRSIVTGTRDAIEPMTEEGAASLYPNIESFQVALEMFGHD